MYVHHVCSDVCAYIMCAKVCKCVHVSVVCMYMFAIITHGAIKTIPNTSSGIFFGMCKTVFNKT